MKYSLTKNKKDYFGITLYQIKAEMSFGNVAKGELGGWIEKKENLDEDGDAWVYGNARVFGDARVYGSAQVSGDARVSGDAWVYGDTWVYGNAQVSGDARVSGDAWVYGDAWVSGNAQVSGDARVSGNARVFGDAWVSGNAQVSGDAWVSGDAQVYGNAQVYGKLKLLAGYFFGVRYNKEEIKYKELDESNDLIYKGEAKFGESEDDEVENAIKLLESKGKLKDGRILI